MKKIVIGTTAALAVTATAFAFSEDGQKFREFLNGLKEAAAVVSTTGTGTFSATINPEETEISYELTFSNLEGDVRQAHIHIGLPQNSGGIVLWLCDSDANPSPSAATPACNSADPTDQRNGSVSGTLTAADVLTAAANGIAPGEFAEVLALIRAGKTYVNVHSVKFPPGEIRSQIDSDSGRHGAHH